MNKTKKGFLTGASVLTIVASCFAVLGALLFFFVGTMMTESFVKEIYLEDPECAYTETADGYYFTYIEDGEEIILTKDDIVMVVNIAKGFCNVVGVVSLATAIAKFVLAIRILINNSKDKYAKGSVIALLILSLLNFNLIEVVLLVVAMCIKKDNDDKEEKRVLDIDIDSIIIE